MNRNTPIPPQLGKFQAYNTPVACSQSGDGTIFYAALGSIGNNKATFFVHVWTEKPDGSLAIIPITNPPNNAPAFLVRSEGLILIGALGTTIVECDVPGYVAPPRPTR